MRYLIILSGIPGCGKSTFIHQQNWRDFTLSFDTFRLLFNSPKLELDGNYEIPSDKKVYDLFNEVLEKRMQGGHFTVLDNTHLKENYFNQYAMLAWKHNYKIIVIDFDVSLELCLARNKIRLPEYKRIPAKVIEKFYVDKAKLIIPKKLRMILASDFILEDLFTWEDLNQYKKIHHLGDIQGVFEVLDKYFQEHPYQEDEFYIFTGDLLDRGKENGQTLQLALELLSKPNVKITLGNHDQHLWNWASNQPIYSSEFINNTQPQLEDAQISKKTVLEALEDGLDYLFYNFGGKKVIVTHGGFDNVPEYPYLISRSQFQRGIGLYEELNLVHQKFKENTPDNYIQIHGHRNRQKMEISDEGRNYNLEGGVEFGGQFRAVQISKDSQGTAVVQTIEIESPYKEWVNPSFETDKVVFTELSQNKYIKQNVFDVTSSFNFNNQAFYSKIWDTQTIKSRGLFVNNKNYSIIIRSYNKFWNIDEVPQTAIENLKQNWKFPLNVYQKENGYLGLLGVDKASNKLVFASKSTIEGDYAKNFKRIFKDNFPNHTLDKIKAFLFEHNLSAVFEVIDPVFDPHIIEYPKSKLVLLDLIKNLWSFEVAGSEEVEDFLNILKQTSAGSNLLSYKYLVTTINNLVEFDAWYEAITTDNLILQVNPIEGFVVSDSEGFLTKIKLPYYSFWKQCRNMLINFNKNTEARTNFKKQNYSDPDLAEQFYNFLREKGENKIYFDNIIQARNNFLSR